MSKRAEQAALKAYPEKWFRDIDGDSYDCNRCERCAYQEGYEQAEKETIERALDYLVSHLHMRQDEKNEWLYEFRKSMEE